MKVCTDACLFGAWVANRFSGKRDQRILDIGTGTGLLSLMLNQKISGNIDAVELDERAAIQAQQNIHEAYQEKNIKVIHADILNFNPEATFNLIVSNPPFFEQDLLSPDPQKNNARHDTSLTLSDLLSCVEKHLAAEGNFAVLLPAHRTDKCIEIARSIHHLYPTEIVQVRQTENHPVFRSMILFSRTAAPPVSKEICIKENQNYSSSFIDLLADYYMFL